MASATSNGSVFDGSAKAGGLLLSAFRNGHTEAIQWVELPVGDLIVTVAADALKGPLGDRAGIRLPVTYEEAVEICRELGCVMPTQEICDAMYARAEARLDHVPLVIKASDSAKMCNCEFVLKFHDRVEKQLAKLGPPPGCLAFGAWKLWILHTRIAEKGAVNYGFWNLKTRKPVQTVGARHDPKHYDYSQLLQPVKRMARHATTGAEVDLLDHFGTQGRIPEQYLSAYRPVAPTKPGAGDLLAVLTAAGLRVVPATGWEKRGKSGFTPEGILLHHTAGPKKGDAPCLTLCIQGGPGVSGPLCHILVARSGAVHLIAAKKANHAGKGAREVLDRIRADEAQVGDAKDHGYRDALIGNAYFYGIEVENSGKPGDEYPQAQIDALVQVCAALCDAHGWSENRVVHHRQWTTRKVDMSYRGDITGAVREALVALKEGRLARIARSAPVSAADPGQEKAVRSKRSKQLAEGGAPASKRAPATEGAKSSRSGAGPKSRAKPTAEEQR